MWEEDEKDDDNKSNLEILQSLREEEMTKRGLKSIYLSTLAHVPAGLRLDRKCGCGVAETLLEEMVDCDDGDDEDDITSKFLVRVVESTVDATTSTPDRSPKAIYSESAFSDVESVASQVNEVANGYYDSFVDHLKSLKLDQMNQVVAERVKSLNLGHMVAESGQRIHVMATEGGQKVSFMITQGGKMATQCGSSVMDSLPDMEPVHARLQSAFAPCIPDTPEEARMREEAKEEEEEILENVALRHLDSLPVVPPESFTPPRARRQVSFQIPEKSSSPPVALSRRRNQSLPTYSEPFIEFADEFEIPRSSSVKIVGRTPSSMLLEI